MAMTIREMKGKMILRAVKFFYSRLVHNKSECCMNSGKWAAAQRQRQLAATAQRSFRTFCR
jgi:hypothetical protein